MGTQHQVELILMRQVASYLAMPIFLVDPDGLLLYFNEPAELILGRRYDEAGEMPLEEWATMFAPSAAGRSLEPAELPLVVALREGRPAHGEFSICGFDGVQREIAVTAFPLLGHGDRDLGAVAIFWEEPSA